MVLVFAIGYAGIIFEESLAFNKSGVGLLMAVCLWVIRSIGVRILMISLLSQFLCFSAGYSATFADNGFLIFTYCYVNGCLDMLYSTILLNFCSSLV